MSFDNLDHRWLNTTYTTTPCLPKTISSRKSWTAGEFPRGTLTYKSVCNWAMRTKLGKNEITCHSKPMIVHGKILSYFHYLRNFVGLSRRREKIGPSAYEWVSLSAFISFHWRRSHRRYPNARESEQKSIIRGAKRKFISPFFIQCCAPPKRKYVYGSR